MLDAKRKTEKKRCPRCGGNIFIDVDQYGTFEHCLRCGHIQDLANGRQTMAKDISKS
jgi:ribosomal protein S27AE